jgi:ABC-type multidrug transport system fused ATPase/permease subunit
MFTGDALAVLLSLGGFALATGVTAYSLSAAKARNLWIVAALFAVATVGWAWLQTRFDAARVYQFLLAVLPVIVVFLVVMIVRNRMPNHQGAANGEGIERKRKLIDDSRRLATIYSQGRAGEKSFRQYLETTQTYAALRQYLNTEYLNKLNAPRTVYAQADGALYEPLVVWFLDDLDRLERDWGLA